MAFISRRGWIRALVSAALLVAADGAAASGYDGMTVTFEKPLEQVQTAAVDALTVIGVEIKKQEPGFVEGKRKNKVGAFVGSGGEVLSVKLTAVDGGKTETKVRTTKTFVGRAGQKVWDQSVIDEMAKSLGTSTAPAAAVAAPAASSAEAPGAPANSAASPASGAPEAGAPAPSTP